MTATQLRELVKGVVEAHDTHNTFYSIWSDVKDRETELTYPCAIWDQWRARLTEDEFGQLHRAVLVRLLVITAVATDRTPAQRDAAVEAADIAAADFILKIRQDYPDLTVTNVSTTTQFDEYTQLETGVLLTFTVEGEGLCLDADHFEPGAGDCDPATVTNSDSSYTQEVAAGATLNLPDVTHTDSDGSPVTLPGMVAFVATPCAPGDDAHVLINQNPVIDLGPGETWDLHVEYPDGTPVGSWNAGAERWEIPECPACDPATAVLKNTDGTILDTEEIPSGGSEDITAPDATAVLKNSEGTTLDTELIPSGVSENIVVADTTIQRKTESGVDIGVTIALPSGTGPHTVTCPNADVTVNNTSFTDVESGSMVDVVVANTDGTKVGSENAGVWEVPDATAVLKNSEGTTLDTELIPSGVSEDVIAPDATVQLKDSAGTNIGTPVAVPSGVSQKITAPDATAVLKNTAGTTLDTEAIPSGSSEDIIVADATVNLVNGDAGLIGTQDIASGVTTNVPVPDTTLQLKDTEDQDIGSPFDVPSGQLNNVAVPDANYTLKDSNGNTVISGAIHPGEMQDIVMPPPDHYYAIALGHP